MARFYYYEATFWAQIRLLVNPFNLLIGILFLLKRISSVGKREYIKAEEGNDAKQKPRSAE